MIAKSVLVVDDDPYVTTAVSAILTHYGYTVEIATNGQEALDALQRLRPSLAIVDLQMPVLDGRGFVHALRQASNPLPVVIMSGDADLCAAARELEAVGCLAKPFDARRLVSAVRAATSG